MKALHKTGPNNQLFLWNSCFTDALITCFFVSFFYDDRRNRQICSPIAKNQAAAQEALPLVSKLKGQLQSKENHREQGFLTVHMFDGKHAYASDACFVPQQVSICLMEFIRYEILQYTYEILPDYHTFCLFICSANHIMSIHNYLLCCCHLASVYKLHKLCNWHDQFVLLPLNTWMVDLITGRVQQ